jgi:hypothetical protein
MASEVTVNPHNRTFAIAIQLGVMGTLALRACGLRISCYFEAVGTAWLGVDNVVCSIVHSRFIPAQTHPC